MATTVAVVKCRTGNFLGVTLILNGTEATIDWVIEDVRNSVAHNERTVERATVTALVGAFRCPHCAGTAIAVCEKCHRLNCCRGTVNLTSSCHWGCGDGPLIEADREEIRTWEDL